MVKISFLCHEPWVKSHADPVLRSIPYLSNEYKIQLIIAAGFYHPDPVWPDNSEFKERERNEKLSDAIKIAISLKPDLILCHHRCITPELLKCKIPLMILEHTDAPALELSRYLIHLENVIGVIKGTIFSKKEYYNGPFCEGMFHGTHLNNINLPICYPKQKLTNIEKIELGYSFGSFPSNKRLLTTDINKKRYIPVSFIGETDYPRSRLISNHRKLAMKSVQKIGIGKKGIPREEYDEILLSSYACLSPLGYGACYRSWEGIYGGCIVIQPDCSYMTSWPNIYMPNQFFIPCDLNFIDLPEIVDNIKKNWDDLQDKREINKKLLLNTLWNEESLGQHLKGIFEKCLQRIKH
jgi:hypothetical protein